MVTIVEDMVVALVLVTWGLAAIIARNKRTRTYIFRILLRLRYRRSQWQTLGAWYKASALGLYVRGICPPIIV